MFRIYLIKHLTDMFFQGENPDKKHVVGVCIVFYAVNSALFICLNISLINLICNVLGIGALVCVYSRNRKYVIFIIVILTIVCMGCDMLATSLLTPAYKSGDALDMLTFVMVDMIMFVFMCLLRRIMQSRNEQQIVPSVALIIVPIISICILLYMAYMKHYISGDFIAVGLGLLCINFLVLYLYNMLLESAQEKYENQILRQYVKEYSNQLDIILESEQKVRRMRHDIRNHLSEIQLLTMQNKRDEVLKYIESMTDYMQNSRAISESGNIETDSLLNYMLGLAKKVGIHVETDICLPEELRNSFEFNIVLGNLLDNAVRAAKSSEEKYLYVRINMDKGTLRILVKNSYSGKLRKSGRHFLTTKDDSYNHGMGLQSVQDVVNQNNGEIQFEATENTFIVRVILFN